ncbi:MAG: CDP-alcohol phosphatidyltransferase family protein [Clostridia bacterium]|nr:CDP-alcohol phosphatidyltransferase family protein [Clostridia bacterium]
MLVGFYNYTVWLTYVGLGSAIVGMNAAIRQDFRLALICLLVCGVCDMFDGTVARTNKRRSDDAVKFGVQIDSLCDLVCFGAFPAVIGLTLCPQSIFTVLAAIVYVLAAVIRLAYFNVQEINRSEADEKREYYLGLPVTSSSVIMPMLALCTALHKVQWFYLYPVGLIAVALAFVLRIKVKKLDLKWLVGMLVIFAAVLVLTIIFGGEIQPLSRVLAQ